MNMALKEKPEKDSISKIEFFGKEYTFEKLNPFTVKITTGDTHKIASFPGELSIDIKKDFYERPYLIKFKEVLQLSPKSQLKLFLKLPLITKLIIKSGDRYLEIDKYTEYNRKAWHGEVHEGVLCTYVQAEFAFEVFQTHDALIPLRLVNTSDVPGEVSKIVIEPENLFLFKGDNGFFTNKLYMLIISSREFRVDYGTNTTTRIINQKVIIDRRFSVAQTVLTKFDKFSIARELGL